MRGLPLGRGGQGTLKHGMVKRGPLDWRSWISDMQKRSTMEAFARDAEVGVL